eukprot:630961-Alexandrium_andersonii.AAC.1
MKQTPNLDCHEAGTWAKQLQAAMKQTPNLILLGELQQSTIMPATTRIRLEAGKHRRLGHARWGK